MSHVLHLHIIHRHLANDTLTQNWVIHGHLAEPIWLIGGD